MYLDLLARDQDVWLKIVLWKSPTRFKLYFSDYFSVSLNQFVTQMNSEMIFLPLKNRFQILSDLSVRSIMAGAIKVFMLRRGFQHYPLYKLQSSLAKWKDSSQPRLEISKIQYGDWYWYPEYANQRTIGRWNKELFCLAFWTLNNKNNVCKQISSLFSMTSKLR